MAGTWLNGDRTGPLGEREDNWLGKSVSGYVVSRHLQGCSPPPVSIKDYSVGPHEQVLNVPIACRRYGSSKPNSLLLMDVWLSPLLHWLARERNWVRTRGSVSRRAGDCVGSPFLGSSDSVQLCRRLVEGCHVRGPPAGSVRWAYVDWCGKRTYRVGRVFPCRVYIDSNHCDSRIWVIACLWQFSRR
jgi:hypothetical protein